MKYKLLCLVVLGVASASYAIEVDVGVPGVAGVGVGVGGSGIGAGANVGNIGGGAGISGSGINAGVATPQGAAGVGFPNFVWIRKYSNADVIVRRESVSPYETAVTVYRSQRFADLPSAYQDELLRSRAWDQQNVGTYTIWSLGERGDLIRIGEEQ